MAASSSAARTARFDRYRVDLSSGGLFRSGVRLPIQSQPFQVLRLLLEAKGEVVTRDQLRKALWPDDTFVDFDVGMNNAVKKLRQALEDSAEHPRFIETLPKIGYRFMVPVEWRNGSYGAGALSVDEPIAPPSSETVQVALAPADESSESRLVPRRLWVVVGVATIAAFLAVGAVWYRARGPKHATEPAITSIAVLPLKNFSGDPSQEYLADGMTEELIGRLSSIHDLRVISRTSVMGFKDTKLSVPEIAKTLGVDAIVEGSVVRDGNHIRVHAQLIRGATDEHFWSQAYDREMRDVLTLESDVAQAIADQVRIQMTPQQQARLHSVREVNPEAYDTYLKGRFLLQMNSALRASFAGSG